MTRKSPQKSTFFWKYVFPLLVLAVIACTFRNFAWVWIPVAIVVILILVIERRRLDFAAKTMAEIDAMDGPAFELYLESFFRARGYKVIHTGRSGDFGADLILQGDDGRIAVQAKNYDTGEVGNKAVQEAFAASSYYGCGQAMVVTNARFTEAAREQARGCRPPVVLVGRDELEHLLKRTG
jgi:restriction system protein